MDRQGKAKLKDEVAERLEKANAVIIAEYRGLTVEEMTGLRVQLRKAGAEFRVFKNRIAKKAIDDKLHHLKDLNPSLKGPIGLICSYGDAAQTAKAVLEFGKDHPNLVVTCGFMDKSTVTADELKALADLPSKDVLLAQIIGSLVAPHRGLLGVLNGVNRNLVQVINAIKDKKSS